MNTKAKRKPIYKQKYSFILLLCLLLLVGYFVISLVKVHSDITQRKKQITQLSSQYEEQVAENAYLASVRDGGDREEYIKQTAREKIGYGMPGEKVYYNITPKN